jgi:hypothetical protein
VVGNSHFTPERIRRLIEEVIPTLTLRTEVSAQAMQEKVSEALTNPTKQMRVSFRNLPGCHRWLLFALLDSNQYSSLSFENSLERSYDNLCPPEAFRPFKSVLTELTEAFVRQVPSPVIDQIDWVHPSCRDLAIEELADSRAERKKFLNHCSQAGLLLATSLAGGLRGERRLPFLQTGTDWQSFESRAMELLDDKPGFVLAIWLNCAQLAKSSETDITLNQSASLLRAIIQEKLIPKASKALSKVAYHNIQALSAFYTVCRELRILVPVKLKRAWDHCHDDAKDWVDSNLVIYQDGETPSRILKFLQIIQDFAPEEYTLALNSGFVAEILHFIAERAENESATSYDFSGENPDKRESIAKDYDELAQTFQALSVFHDLAKTDRWRISKASEHFESEASTLREDAPLEEESESKHHASGDGVAVEVDDLFRDL